MGITQFMGWMALVLIAGIFGLIIVKERYRPLLVLLIVLANTALSSIPSILALTVGPQTGVISIPHLMVDISLKIDSLSAWFILIINFTSITGVLYGTGYLLSLIHISEPTRLGMISYAVF